MAANYITKDGDTFDIMKANPRLRKIIVFDEGINLIIPDIKFEEESTLPPWKK